MCTLYPDIPNMPLQCTYHKVKIPSLFDLIQSPCYSHQTRAKIVEKIIESSPRQTIITFHLFYPYSTFSQTPLLNFMKLFVLCDECTVPTSIYAWRSYEGRTGMLHLCEPSRSMQFYARHNAQILCTLYPDIPYMPLQCTQHKVKIHSLFDFMQLSCYSHQTREKIVENLI